jgi:hypothetical protein
MASILKWQEVSVDKSQPVRIRVTGNVDTRVVTRYFWLPVNDATSDGKWDRDDGGVLEFDTSRIKVGQQNHLGFSCRAAPVVPTERNLFIVLEVRQGNTVLLEQAYSLEVADQNTPVRVSDGITLAV